MNSIYYKMERVSNGRSKEIKRSGAKAMINLNTMNNTHHNLTPRLEDKMMIVGQKRIKQKESRNAKQRLHATTVNHSRSPYEILLKKFKNNKEPVLKQKYVYSNRAGNNSKSHSPNKIF